MFDDISSDSGEQSETQENKLPSVKAKLPSTTHFTKHETQEPQNHQKLDGSVKIKVSYSTSKPEPNNNSCTADDEKAEQKLRPRQAKELQKKQEATLEGKYGKALKML